MTQYAGIDAYPADFTIPDDTAPPTASNLLVSIEALGDRTTWLKNRTGTWRIVDDGTVTIADAFDALALVDIGGTDAKWDQITYGASGRGPLIAAIPVSTLLATDIIEVEVEGTALVTGDGTSTNASWLRLTRDNGSVVAGIAGAKAYFENPYYLAGIAEIVQDGDSGAAFGPTPVLVSWVGPLTFVGGAQHAMLPVDAKKNDVVEFDGFYFVSASTSTTGTAAILRFEVKEGAGSYAAVPGARSYTFTSTSTGDQATERGISFRHKMAADGVCTAALNAKVDDAAVTAFLIAPTRCAAKVWRPGFAAQNVKLEGVFVSGGTALVNIALDGRVGTLGTVIEMIGAITCRWRVWRSNA